MFAGALPLRPEVYYATFWSIHYQRTKFVRFTTTSGPLSRRAKLHHPTTSGALEGGARARARPDCVAPNEELAIRSGRIGAGGRKWAPRYFKLFRCAARYYLASDSLLPRN